MNEAKHYAGINAGHNVICANAETPVQILEPIDGVRFHDVKEAKKEKSGSYEPPGCCEWDKEEHDQLTGNFIDNCLLRILFSPVQGRPPTRPNACQDETDQ